MKISIEFDTDNAAFDDGGIEIRRILYAIACEITDGKTTASIRDINGNTIGNWSWGE